MLNQTQLQDIRLLLKKAAQQYILPGFRKVGHDYKDDGSLITEVDLNVQQFLTTELQALFPQIRMLAEEMPAPQQHELLENNPDGIWCLDPLDGTRNFASGVPFFSISLALIIKNHIVMGLVYDPVHDECFSAIRGQGAWLNNNVLELPAAEIAIDQSTAIIDFKRLPAKLAQHIVGQPPYSSQRSLGSVALDWCYLASARCHLYLHGAQNLWDYAAGYLVFNEAAGKNRVLACTLDGEDVYNCTLAKRSAVAAVNDSLFEQWSRFLSVDVINR